MICSLPPEPLFVNFGGGSFFEMYSGLGPWTPLYQGLSSVDMERRHDNTVVLPETDLDAEPESPKIDGMMWSLHLNS